MRSTIGLVGTAALVGLMVSACATGEEWTTWREHPTHFASGDHMGFSLRNRTDGTSTVRRADVAMARDQAWWGKPVTVTEGQILER